MACFYFETKCPEAEASLSEREKNEYVQYKTQKYLKKIKSKYPAIGENLETSNIVNIDVSLYHNMRDINNEIMRQIADVLYDKVEMEENE